MAISVTQTSQIPYNSPGIYFQETDLTVITRQTGGFSAAALALTEKGPAFVISNSTTFEDRAFRLGDQNPDFPSSYYAKQYLEQARDYKEVRMLGLEGYKDTVGYGITIAGTGSTPTNIGSATPLSPGPQGLVCVLKSRPTSITGSPAVVSVVVATTSFTDPLTGGTIVAANDYLFSLVISYATGPSDTVVVSLRPESKDYIITKFGTDPLKQPLMGNKVATLWVDFIIPSTTSMPTINSTKGYYVPGVGGVANYIDLTQGETAFGTTFTFQSNIITGITATSLNVTLTATGSPSWLTTGSFIQLTGVPYTPGNFGILNGTWKVGVVTAGVNNTFTILDPNTNLDITTVIPNTLTGLTGTIAANYIVPTWENMLLDYSNQTFTTPQTPWFVSDGDSNGHIKNLFQLWSISDGESANTEIKISVENITTTTYNGNGSFDIVVRLWNDTDDTSPSILESFRRLTMDSTNPNYILRRIGDGDQWPLNSRFIFVALNTDIEIDADDLPWGCLGYPNVAGSKIQDVPWTLDYVKTKSSAKQTLGLANNNINMNQAMTEGFLQLKTGNTITGKGFHLNPNLNANLVTEQSAVLTFAANTIYLDNNGNQVLQTEQIKRSKFVVDFYGGFDGWNVYSTRTWSDSKSADYQSLQLAIAAVADKEDINSDFTVLVTPDLNIDDDPDACSSVLDMINARADCLYIPDFAYDPNADPNNSVNSLTESNMMSNNVAMYVPYLQMQDTLNNVNNWLPPSILALGTIAYVATNENVWQPPGGSIRTVTNNLVRSRRRLTQTDREILFTANINPITTFPGSGYEISGVRTTQADFSALSFIHNRLLLCYAKKILTQTLRPLLFSLNGQFSQDAFLSTVRPIFARIKKLNGIADFKVNIVNNDQTAADKTTLYGQIVIQPLYPIERIIVDFVIADNAVSFAG